MGLEPTTARLRAARSTDWARKATDMFLFTSSFFSNFFYLFFIFIFICERGSLWVYVYMCMRESMREWESEWESICVLFWRDETRLLCWWGFFSCSFPLPLTLFFFLTLTHFFLFTFYCAVLVLPLILFPLFSLGSFRGSVGRAIGC